MRGATFGGRTAAYSVISPSFVGSGRSIERSPLGAERRRLRGVEAVRLRSHAAAVNQPCEAALPLRTPACFFSRRGAILARHHVIRRPRRLSHDGASVLRPGGSGAVCGAGPRRGEGEGQAQQAGTG